MGFCYYLVPKIIRRNVTKYIDSKSPNLTFVKICNQTFDIQGINFQNSRFYWGSMLS